LFVNVKQALSPANLVRTPIFSQALTLAVRNGRSKLDSSAPHPSY